MESLGVIAVVLLVLVLLVAAVLTFALRRRRRPVPGQPRTVADLVRMRGGAAVDAEVTDSDRRDDIEEPEVEVSAAAVSEVVGSGERPATSPLRVETDPVPADPRPPALVGAAVVGAAPVGADRDGRERSGGVPAAVADTVPGQDTAVEETEDAPLGYARDDTPWARAARMTVSDGPTVPAARRPHPEPTRDEVLPPRFGSGWPSLLPPAPVHVEPSDAEPDSAAAEPLPAPVLAEPEASRSPVGRPADVEPLTVTPAADAPRAVELNADEPAKVEPSAVEPAGVEPDAVEAATVEPSPVEPSPVEPSAVEPASVEPVAADVAAVEPAPAAADADDRESVHVGPAGPADGPVATPARTAGRVRRLPSDTAAEQAAADLALLRTFGVSGPGRAPEPDDEETELAVRSSEPAGTVAGTAQDVTVHVVGRTGVGIVGAVVTLHDHLGQETASVPVDAHGCATLIAPHPGGYVLVAASDGHQPGAAALTVDDATVEAEIVLTRSASLSGTVTGEDGPQAGARVVLVQDGETLEATSTGPDGGYRFGDLTAGEYGLSVTAPDCEPAAVLVRVPEEQQVRHDVELDPAGLPDDVVAGPFSRSGP